MIPPHRKHKLLLVLAAAAALAVVGALWLLTGWTNWRPRAPEDSYQTAPVTRGDVVVSISATGTLNPVNVVSVGTQVSGSISRIYVDYNDVVTTGQLLAELDPSVYEAAITQSRANLLSARAALQLTRQTEDRNRALFNQDLITRQELDEAVQRRIAAQAQVTVAEGQLSRDTSNLGYTKVHAPISGVVLSREVAVGQTVAASFQTPTLFKIAENLSTMRIECSVAEADIGSLRIGQRVTFTVDAFPGKEFDGVLRQVRLDPKTDNGLVTYVVIIDVKNSGGDLMPGMTALVSIILEERRNVLRVPNAAIAFASTSGRNADRGRRAVYVLDERQLKAVPVTVGLSDGEQTEIRSGALAAGILVAVGERVEAQAKG